MARIFPFPAWRYTEKAGDLNRLVTQPYDKISPEMQRRYLEASPYNLVRIILGERFDSDAEGNNVYTRAAASLRDWIAGGVLARDPEPALYAYFQEFTVPGTDEKLTRKGFIGLGAVEDYSEGTVHRHEHTLSGPKKDRRELLEHTRAHFGQIFMLYPDPEGRVDAILDHAAAEAPIEVVTDEYGTVHRVWRIADPAAIREIEAIMADRKLLIADGHHRYETALAFRSDHPELEGAQRVMMTFVNMHSDGLRILATHRVMHDLDPARVAALPGGETLGGIEELERRFAQPAPDRIRIAIATPDGIRLFDQPREGRLDVAVLHSDLIESALGVSAEAVREGRHMRYVRGLREAYGYVERGEAQVAFLLEPTTIQQVADTSFGGGVMPQKSTDFYPKLLSGLTIYKLEK